MEVGQGPIGGFSAIGGRGGKELYVRLSISRQRNLEVEYL
jgi:hypothetical protein